MPRSRSQEVPRTVAGARARLTRLQAERHEARAGGVDPASRYMEHLDAAVAEARVAYVISAVTEIAALRAELDGVHAG
jgi:uncharacterized protein involved in exopolysaccharide biosynthesis